MLAQPVQRAYSKWSGMVAKLVLAALLIAPASLFAAEFKNGHLLVDAAWLQARLGTPNLVIVDARNQAQYLLGHIPGAVVSGGNGAIVDRDAPVDGLLIGPDAFTAFARNLGINQDSEIVIYDAGNSQASARLFYALEYYGLSDQVKILNGGFQAWTAAGAPLSVEPVTPAAGNFVAAANVELITTADQIVANFDDPNVIFLDTRSAGEYAGTDVRAAEGGHIPGAVHLEWTNNLVATSGAIPYFKSAEDLSALYASLGLTEDVKIVPYCQTNIRGAHTYFVLRLLGFTDISPYEASWAEYGNVATLPKGLPAALF